MRRIYFGLIFFVLSCSSEHNKYFKIVEGQWQITTFYHNGNKMNSEEHFLMGFDKNNHLWITIIEDRSNEFVSSRCKFKKNLKNLEMDIFDSEDKRFNGNYDVHIDTLENNKEEYILQLTLDTEDTYIQAIRPILKNKFPSG